MEVVVADWEVVDSEGVGSEVADWEAAVDWAQPQVRPWALDADLHESAKQQAQKDP